MTQVCVVGGPNICLSLGQTALLLVGLVFGGWFAVSSLSSMVSRLIWRVGVKHLALAGIAGSLGLDVLGILPLSDLLTGLLSGLPL